MKDKNWFVESALLVAVLTGLLYSFGHFYFYRVRYEFGIDTISLGLSYESFIQAGASIVIAWFGRTWEFWAALVLIVVLYLVIQQLTKREYKVAFFNSATLTFVMSLVVIYASVSRYIPQRAATNVAIIEMAAESQRHRLILESDNNKVGYTIIASSSKLAFLSDGGEVSIHSFGNIKQIVVKPND